MLRLFRSLSTGWLVRPQLFISSIFHKILVERRFTKKVIPDAHTGIAKCNGATRCGSSVTNSWTFLMFFVLMPFAWLPAFFWLFSFSSAVLLRPFHGPLITLWLLPAFDWLLFFRCRCATFLASSSSWRAQPSRPIFLNTLPLFFLRKAEKRDASQQNG